MKRKQPYSVMSTFNEEEIEYILNSFSEQLKNKISIDEDSSRISFPKFTKYRPELWKSFESNNIIYYVQILEDYLIFAGDLKSAINKVLIYSQPE
ncbi:hypothetical protein ACFO0S_14230 [Chryseomicrobium palamuruense]|uniref:Uncharacterized protein n=1 Tax=Chryseomicrobium palamuruense TaxID=682973 RepID=A0ABV8UYR4_9BACL